MDTAAIATSLRMDQRPGGRQYCTCLLRFVWAGVLPLAARPAVSVISDSRLMRGTTTERHLWLCLRVGGVSAGLQTGAAG